MRVIGRSSDVCSSDLLVARKGSARAPRRRDRPQGASVLRCNRKGAGFPASGIHRPSAPRAGEQEIHNAPSTVRLIGSSKERSVGKECDSTFRSRWSAYHKTKKKQNKR